MVVATAGIEPATFCISLQWFNPLDHHSTLKCLIMFSPSGHVKTNEEPNMAKIEQYSGMNVFVAVADGVKTVIVMEEDSLILNSSVSEIKRDDTILWMFGDDNAIIANMNKAAGIFSTKEDERFGDRLELDKQTGSLTIRDIRTEHTGLYQLKIKSTTETLKRFSVTVRELPQSSHWKITGPVLGGVASILIGICIGIMMGCIKVSWPCKKRGNQKTRTPTDAAEPEEKGPLSQGSKAGNSPTE